MTIEVITFGPRGRIDCGEADTPEAALVAAQTLYDEARAHAKPVSVGFYVDGKLVRLHHRRPTEATTA